jgi:hypothetical protein
MMNTAILEARDKKNARAWLPWRSLLLAHRASFTLISEITFAIESSSFL